MARRKRVGIRDKCKIYYTIKEGDLSSRGEKKGKYIPQRIARAPNSKWGGRKRKKARSIRTNLFQRAGIAQFFQIEMIKYRRRKRA